ncbi:MAG: hypothetical protein HRU25_00385 [Psychrobium sp.]|nr:hypothetical protein [Psychrobium sp.]
MKITNLKQDENLSITLSHQLQPLEHQRIDLYFSLPNEMGIGPQTLEEQSYFHSSIKTRSAYYSDQLHLPLVRSRFISAKKGGQDDYRVNLNLFSYQIKMALDTDINQILQNKEQHNYYLQSVEVAEQSISLLKKLRRNSPSDKRLKSYFENADNYLSWHVEQSFLKLLAKGPKTSDDSDARDFLLNLCRCENDYRGEKQYNSQITIGDPNRITNKMRLLQHLIEYGVVFKRDVRHLNKNLRRLVRGTVTAIIMAFVMTLVLNARTTFTEVTIVLVAILGVIYGLRETFKDDITQLIWRKIQHGLPKWQHVFSNSATKTIVAKQTIWLEYLDDKDLPEDVSSMFDKRRQQNKMAAQILHFRSNTKVIAKRFLPGYDEIQQRISFNLAPFVRFLKKGEGRLYHLEGQKISQQGVERRYQVNLLLVQSNKEKKYLQRFKVTLNRSGIINIEAMKAFHS